MVLTQSPGTSEWYGVTGEGPAMILLSISFIFAMSIRPQILLSALFAAFDHKQDKLELNKGILFERITIFGQNS